MAQPNLRAIRHVGVWRKAAREYSFGGRQACAPSPPRDRTPSARWTIVAKRRLLMQCTQTIHNFLHAQGMSALVQLPQMM